MPKMFSSPEAIAEDIIRDVGSNLVVGLPLGLGKANHIVNALYARAVADRSIRLTVFTQLVAKRVVDGVARYSLSCNTDTTLDVLQARAEGRASFKLVAQVNSELPFM